MEYRALAMKKQLVASLLSLFVFCCVNNVVAQDKNKWEFDATIYLWATDIGGSTSPSSELLPGGSFDIEVDDIIDNLNMTFMGGVVARKNRWSIITDVIFLGVDNDKDSTIPTSLGVPASASVGMDIDTWILGAEVGYDVVNADKGELAIVGGLRYATMDVDVTIGIQGQQVAQSQSEDLLDGVVGVRGRINLNENWYLPYYADIGAGDSDLTWQALAGIGYQFGWGDIKLVYRYLGYEMEDENLLQDLDISGFALGFTYRF